MTFKSVISACVAICITAILGIAVCGCDDLGEYSDTDEYYSSFGDIIMIGGTDRGSKEYSVKDYFYNKESREDFLEGEDGVYTGVTFNDYVYVAIPFKADINMDSIALYIKSQTDATVFINVFVTDRVPSEWKPNGDNNANQNGSDEATDVETSVPNEETGDTTTGESSVTPEETTAVTAGESSDLPEETTETPGEETGVTTEETTDEPTEDEETYDDPDPETRVGEITVNLNEGKWGSFVLDTFNVNGVTHKSIEIKDGQYILLQIRNNSGIRIFDPEKQTYVDPQTGLELPRVNITMTNLLIRALEIENDS